MKTIFMGNLTPKNTVLGLIAHNWVQIRGFPSRLISDIFCLGKIVKMKQFVYYSYNSKKNLETLKNIP